MMALVVLDRRAVLQANQNRVDPMVFQPPEGAPHSGLELLDRNASQNIVRANLPQHEIRQLECDFIHHPLGSLSGDFAPMPLLLMKKSWLLNVRSRMSW